MAAGAAVLWGPFWMQGSLAELPGFTEMSRQWEFNSSVFALISWFAGRFPAQVAGALGLILLYVYHEVRLPGRAEWPRGDWVYGGFFLLVPVVNPWYLLWVLPFAVIRPSAWALSSLAFVSMSYVHGLNLGSGGLAPYEHPAWLRPLEYGGIAAGAWCGREVVRRLA